MVSNQRPGRFVQLYRQLNQRINFDRAPRLSSIKLTGPKSCAPTFGPCRRHGESGSPPDRALEQEQTMFKSLKTFVADESGVTAIEYALIASLIAVFIITAIQTVGTKVSTVFTEVGNTLK
jgi:pilus assembly protein Flp/PilA